MFGSLCDHERKGFLKVKAFRIFRSRSHLCGNYSCSSWMSGFFFLRSDKHCVSAKYYYLNLLIAWLVGKCCLDRPEMVGAWVTCAGAGERERGHLVFQSWRAKYSSSESRYNILTPELNLAPWSWESRRRSGCFFVQKKYLGLV